jgi:isopenicillin N synthase-like dioxygenase
MSVIDFSYFRIGSIQDRKQIASEIDDAFKTTGFLFLQNHGIPQSRIDACFEQVSQRLYLQP